MLMESPDALSREPSDRFHVILVEPEIAANVGAIGRTCVASGAMLWMVRPLGFHLTDSRIKRAGLDYWPHLDWKVVDHLDEVVDALGPDRLWSFTTKASRSYINAQFQQGDGLVFGPESRGLARSWLESQAGRTLRIPIEPEARSLNLGTSVAIGLFEALRQSAMNPTRTGLEGSL
jgi:tRNA (cytidine/uridine-2'-O-)-methyltransferase